MCLTSITALDSVWSWHQKCFHWYKKKQKTTCTVNARDLFNIFFELFPVLDRNDSTEKELPASTLQKTLAGQQRRGLILWKRRFLTWHFPVVWRGFERDFCELRWLLQINSSSLSLSLSPRQLVWHLNQIKQGFPSTSPLRNWALPPNPNR